MFSFTDPNPTILEHNIDWGEAQNKYHDSYMIVINSHLEGSRLHGDIVAILTPEEYFALNKPNPLVPKYEAWIGVALQTERIGARGFRMSSRG
jgi:hypothetical protein